MVRAVFEPFPPHLNIADVVESTPTFEFVPRIACDAIDQWPCEDFERLVFVRVVQLGLPLVIEGFQDRLDQNLFSEKWLREHYSTNGKLFPWIKCFFFHDFH